METYPRYFQLLQLRSKLIIFKSHGFPVIGEINITFCFTGLVFPSMHATSSPGITRDIKCITYLVFSSVGYFFPLLSTIDVYGTRLSPPCKLRNQFHHPYFIPQGSDCHCWQLALLFYSISHHGWSLNIAKSFDRWRLLNAASGVMSRYNHSVLQPFNFLLSLWLWLLKSSWNYVPLRSAIGICLDHFTEFWTDKIA